jgi:hypothetical protein
MAEVVFKDRLGEERMIQFIFSNYAKDDPKNLPRLRVNMHLYKRYEGDAIEFSTYIKTYASRILPTQFYVAGYKYRELFPLLVTQKILRFVDCTADMTYQLCEFVDEDLKSDAEEVMAVAAAPPPKRKKEETPLPPPPPYNEPPPPYSAEPAKFTRPRGGKSGPGARDS